MSTCRIIRATIASVIGFAALALPGLAAEPAAIDLTFGSDAPLDLPKEPVGVVERDAGGTKEEHRCKAKHGQINMQPARELGETDGQPAPKGATIQRERPHCEDCTGALRRYSIVADLISTLPLSSSLNGCSPTVITFRMLW